MAKMMKNYKEKMVEDDFLVQYYKGDPNDIEGYEDDYHSYTHKNLLNNMSYYLARADISKLLYFKDVTDERVLEFGCGLGQNIALLENSWGYDISKFALAKAKENGVKVIANLKECKNFDIVFSRHVLEHVVEPMRELKKMGECLCEGGKLILVLPVEHQRKVALKLSDNQHLYCWNFQTINNLLVKSGFRPVANKFTRGTGYNKLLFLHRISTPLYGLATRLASYYAHSREIVVEAIKE